MGKLNNKCPYGIIVNLAEENLVKCIRGLFEFCQYVMLSFERFLYTLLQSISEWA